MTAVRQPTSDRQQPSSWSERSRFIVSLLLIGHLLAVAVPPLAFQTNGPLGLSPAVETVLLPVEQYSQFMYLDRGYAFFAPDPGPSHLIQAGLTNDAGTLTEKMYPDLEQQWPRLLYHRHFMLAEFLTNTHQPPGPPPELIQADPDTATSWRNARSRYEHLRLSMTKHLEHAHPGQTAAIRRIEHLIPGVLEFREEPIVLTDKRLYQVLLDNPAAVQTNGDLVAPDRSPEAIAVPQGLESANQKTVPPAKEQPAATAPGSPPATIEPPSESNDEDETNGKATEAASAAESKS